MNMNTSTSEEDCDDLPPITVNSSANNSSTFVMPRAEELAQQRARELECVRQLEQLRQRARDDDGAAALPRSDSSGSEGELALAAAVTALSVRAPPPRAPPPRAPAAPRAAALWAALAPLLPPGAPPAPQGARLTRAVLALAAALAGARAGCSDGDVLCCGALLSVAALAHDSRARRDAARALHALLDDHATPAQACSLVRALLAALPAARARLQLADALRSGAGGGADRAAHALAAAAALQLLGDSGEGGAGGARAELERVAAAAGAWRACGAAARVLCVQLAGRLLAAGGAGAEGAGAGARALLLERLAPPPAAAHALRPDRLEASVGASKLKLLFSATNGDTTQPLPPQDNSTLTIDMTPSENNTV